VTLFAEFPSQSSDVLLSGVEPSDAIIIIAPCDFLSNETWDGHQVGQFYLWASDGSNTSEREFWRYVTEVRFITLNSPGFYVGRVEPSERSPLTVSIEGVEIGRTVRVRYLLTRLFPHAHLEYQHLLTVAVQSSIESIMLPLLLWDVPLSDTPGLWASAIATSPQDDVELFGYGCIRGDGSSLFRFTLTDPISPDLTQFSVDKLPSGFLCFSVSGFNAPYCVTRSTLRHLPLSAGTVVPNLSTVRVPLSFWSECDLTPGQHTFEIFATTQDDRTFTEPIVSRIPSWAMEFSLLRHPKRSFSNQRTESRQFLL
jgi:hypothetical protein